jgi:hypothetical protein
VTRPVRTEKRRAPRVRIHLDVEFTIRDSFERAMGVANDISQSGMFIETSSPAPFGAGVSIEFEAPARGGATVVPATVRWTSAEGMGVQFGLLGARETYAIAEIMNKADAR